MNQDYLIEDGKLLAYTGHREDLVVPDGVLCIGEKAFHGNQILRSVTLPQGVTNIEDHAFDDCKNLTMVWMPNTVENIGALAFNKCGRLKSLTLSTQLKTLGDYAFNHCNKLKKKLYDNAYYIGHQENPYLILLKAKDFGITSCKIHKDTKNIVERAFRFCESLEAMTMPKSLLHIKRYAFMHCKQLKIIVLPKSLMTISSLAFYRCTSLQKIYYNGTIIDWKSNPLFEFSSTVFEKLCFYSETKPTIEGKYWYYKNRRNKIVEW